MKQVDSTLSAGPEALLQRQENCTGA